MFSIKKMSTNHERKLDDGHVYYYIEISVTCLNIGGNAYIFLTVGVF